MHNRLQQTHFIATSQGRVAFLDTKPHEPGDFPTILFIHGHCTHKGFFEKQFESELFSKFRLIALDLPGYGESEPPLNAEKVYSFPGFAEIVKEVVNALNLDNYIIVGWSLGGHVALELTSRLTPLKGLLITGTPPIEVSIEGLGKGFKIADPKILACFGKGDLSEEEAELFATISGYDYTPQKRFIVDAIHNTDIGAKTIYPLSIVEGVGQNEVTLVKEWPKPIAVVAGANDTGINNDYIMNDVPFKNLWRKQVYVVPQAGHAVFLDQPELFNQYLYSFAEETLA